MDIMGSKEGNGGNKYKGTMYALHALKWIDNGKSGTIIFHSLIQVSAMLLCTIIRHAPIQ